MTTLRYLTDEQTALLKSKVEWVLSEVGVRVESAELRDMYRARGAAVSEDDIVRLAPELLHELIATVPRSFYVRDMLGSKFELGGGEQYATGLIVDPNIIDSATRRPRPAVSRDVYRSTAINMALPDIVLTNLMDLPMADIPGPESADRALQLYLQNNHKCMVIDPCSPGMANKWRALIPTLYDGDDCADAALLFMLTSVISPLTLAKENSDLLKIAAEFNMGLMGASCPIAGATAPYSQMGAVVQSFAENLFIITAGQLYSPGMRTFSCTGPSVMELRTGASIYAPLDKMMWKLASMQLGRAFGLPVAAEAGGSTSFRPDLQTGAETMGQMLATVLGGADMVSGVGAVYNAVGMSAESLLYEYEWLRYAKFVRAGFDGRMQPERVVQSIAEQGPGGNFLTDELTVENLRSGLFFEPGLFDYEGKFAEQDGMFLRCRERADELEAAHVSRVPGRIREGVDKFFRDGAG